jgi:hypothetical protein
VGPSCLLFKGKRDYFWDLQWLGHPSTAEIKNEWRCTSIAKIYLQGMDRDKFTFIFYLAHFLSTSRWYRLRCLEMFSAVFSL